MRSLDTEPMSLPDTDRKLLHQLVMDSIEYSLENGSNARFESTLSLSDYPDSLKENRASFVTLNIQQQLRGCIGTLEAYQPLVIDVVQNARSAAFHDPRFSPLSEKEFSQLQVHISVLSIPEPMAFDSEQDLLQQIRPGVDGLILSAAGHRGTFLPSVWDSLPNTEDFWLHLKSKAGLAQNYWSDELRVDRYTTESF